MIFVWILLGLVVLLGVGAVAQYNGLISLRPHPEPCGDGEGVCHP